MYVADVGKRIYKRKKMFIYSRLTVNSNGVLERKTVT